MFSLPPPQSQADLELITHPVRIAVAPVVLLVLSNTATAYWPRTYYVANIQTLLAPLPSSGILVASCPTVVPSFKYKSYRKTGNCVVGIVFGYNVNNPT